MPQVQELADVTLQASRLAVSELFDEAYLTHYRVLPLEIRAGVLLVATEGPLDDDVADHLRQVYDAQLQVLQVDAESLDTAIRASMGQQASVERLVATLGGRADSGRSTFGVSDARDMANQPPVVRYVNLLVAEAFERRASDIHMEASGRDMQVRIRVDGVLTPLASPPQNLRHAITSRIKLLAELDIAQQRKPQDGRMRLRLERRELDVRVSTVPTMFGESLVLRLLDVGEKPRNLADLGIDATLRRRLEGQLERQSGLLLATGPTGSGKTTTLHCALGVRASGREKVITVEDPIEYFIEGVTQVPVLGEAGVSFAVVLRSVLRQDPDVVMVGEMRDADTAAVAVQAALTGHLVLSTLHTIDALTAVARLRDLGVPPYLIGATLACVLAQRLARRLCEHCKVLERRPAVFQIATDREAESIQSHYGPRGCVHCNQSGFRGRVGLYELLVVTEEMRALIAAMATTDDLGRQARRDGVTSLRGDAFAKVCAGHTSIAEITRVLGAMS